ncbi:13202_t:CDS:10 [Entrophospora sp. SA101]|nr:13202_t:CDS:10 [Entrophospora sp. SA101]
MSRKQDTLAVCGNPLYLEWLKVWMENAKDNNNTKLYYTYKKAFESMSVYPLPFNHPREAAILSGIGPIICKKLEKKLKEHCDEHDLTMPEPPDEISSSKQVVVTENINQDQEKRNSNFFEPKKRKKATSSKTYVPKYRTGPYAIMVALYKSYKDELTHSMTKSDLLREAQKYSDTSFEVSNNRRKHYTAWSSVKILLERDYVYKSGCPSRFSLTDIGMSVAQQMADIQIEQGHEAINTVDENQLNSNDEKNVNESDTIEIKESVASNTEGNQQGAIEIEDNLTAEPVLTLEPYCSNNINLPNYDFEDRDFIQDALINRGVKLSVRSLELGDVLWVAKKYGSTTKDEEIVLDYIIERKRMDDLIGSIKDGRFREQKIINGKSDLSNEIQSSAASSTTKSTPARWADLLRTNGANNHNSAQSTPQKSNNTTPKLQSSSTFAKQRKSSVSLPNGKPILNGLTGILKSYELSLKGTFIQPRGLMNNGNTCFMNAILQPLSHCPPLYNLLMTVSKEVAHSFKSKTPLIDSLVMFMNEYKQSKLGDNAEEYGEPFLPEYVYYALRGLKRFNSMKGRQEDAEEFLCFLLDGLHEEFLTLGPRNKTSYTRTVKTPVSRIFGGQFRSVLKCPGSNDSITLQPYQSLQLDIQPDDVKTIGDALKNLTAPERVDDFYSTQKGGNATKNLSIQTLPPILILHLKRFVYDNVGGTQKLSKFISYPAKLNIQADMFAPSRRPSQPAEYKLFVVYHHGKSAMGGHYTCDILRQNAEWLHIDDTVITPISAEDVALAECPTQPTDRLAYILFYMKSN